MRRLLSFTLVAVVTATEAAHAADFAVVATAPGALNILVLVGAVIGAFGAHKVQEAVRGGLLSKCWQAFAGGFVLLGLAQVLTLAESVSIVTLPSLVVPALWMLMVACFAYGVFLARRTLS